jgi:hypothetical protein
MSKPKLFVGSSQKNLSIAQILADSLEEVTDVTIWNEGVFGLNQGFLDTLLSKLREFDFAAFVLAPDDVTTSKDEERPSPRDNVLFESGLFMGELGPDCVFLVFDQDVPLKIPSDLAGVTLAPYDGKRIAAGDAAAAMRKASLLIKDKISAARYPHLVGQWKSEYPLTFEEGMPQANEVIELRPSRDGLCFTTTSNSYEDYYEAFGRLVSDRQIIGTWKSFRQANDMQGAFILTVSPNAGYMYGYFTSPDENGGIVYAPWTISKMTGVNEDRVNERMRRAQEILRSTTMELSKPKRSGDNG